MPTRSTVASPDAGNAVMPIRLRNVVGTVFARRHHDPAGADGHGAGDARVRGDHRLGGGPHRRRVAVEPAGARAGAALSDAARAASLATCWHSRDAVDWAPPSITSPPMASRATTIVATNADRETPRSSRAGHAGAEVVAGVGHGTSLPEPRAIPTLGTAPPVDRRRH